MTDCRADRCSSRFPEPPPFLGPQESRAPSAGDCTTQPDAYTGEGPPHLLQPSPSRSAWSTLALFVPLVGSVFSDFLRPGEKAPPGKRGELMEQLGRAHRPTPNILRASAAYPPEGDLEDVDWRGAMVDAAVAARVSWAESFPLFERASSAFERAGDTDRAMLAASGAATGARWLYEGASRDPRHVLHELTYHYLQRAIDGTRREIALRRMLLPLLEEGDLRGSALGQLHGAQTALIPLIKESGNLSHEMGWAALAEALETTVELFEHDIADGDAVRHFDALLRSAGFGGDADGMGELWEEIGYPPALYELTIAAYARVAKTERGLRRWVQLLREYSSGPVIEHDFAAQQWEALSDRYGADTPMGAVAALRAGEEYQAAEREYRAEEHRAAKFRNKAGEFAARADAALQSLGFGVDAGRAERDAPSFEMVMEMAHAFTEGGLPDRAIALYQDATRLLDAKPARDDASTSFMRERVERGLARAHRCAGEIAGRAGNRDAQWAHYRLARWDPFPPSSAATTEPPSEFARRAILLLGRGQEEEAIRDIEGRLLDAVDRLRAGLAIDGQLVHEADRLTAALVNETMTAFKEAVDVLAHAAVVAVGDPLAERAVRTVQRWCAKFYEIAGMHADAARLYAIAGDTADARRMALLADAAKAKAPAVGTQLSDPDHPLQRNREVLEPLRRLLIEESMIAPGDDDPRRAVRQEVLEILLEVATNSPEAGELFDEATVERLLSAETVPAALEMIEAHASAEAQVQSGERSIVARVAAAAAQESAERRERRREIERVRAEHRGR